LCFTFKKISFSFSHHAFNSKYFAPKDEFIEPLAWKPIIASGFELHPNFIAMVHEQTFSS
jgi:hypothetical protein